MKTNTEYSNEILALAQFLDVAPDEISEAGYDHYDALIVLSYGSQEYAVGDDNDADSAWETSLESYLEECIYPELPESMRNYFDDEAWKRDARIDGRGHSLSSYDGAEKEQTIDRETYYIFRIN